MPETRHHNLLTKNLYKSKTVNFFSHSFNEDNYNCFQYAAALSSNHKKWKNIEMNIEKYFFCR